ncbi:MAG: gamma-glutamyl-gamma-aminobutyrate hydrolase family protein [Lachnospiraceae bacterium]|nr:gamma-glutamyl-gamma-aminobutyrate hydrolase family protein [Lachnospiraceae bacterium]
MKKILIAGNQKDTKNYVEVIKYLGAEPVVSLHPESVYSFDGLILPGGGDICPSYFNQPVIDTRKADPDLDRSQFHILYQFLHTHKPILGICKGMQLINIFFGGDLKQHIDSEKIHQWNGADQWHLTKVMENSILDKLYGTEFEVNSAHHQSIENLGQDLEIIQHSEDGVPEALSHEFLPILGVQWHPERMCLAHEKSGTVSGTAIFRWLLNYRL